MSNNGGGGGGMMMVVVLIVAVMSSCCMAAGAVGLTLYKNPNFLKELLGDISLSTSTSTPGTSTGTPAGSTSTTDCTAKAQTECASKRGKDRETCLRTSKAACTASGGTTGGCGESAVELFDDRDYKGRSVKLKCGEHINLSQYGMNDKISSMKIPSNIKVIAYNNADYKGDTGVFKNNIAYVGSPFGNEITSLKIVPVTETNPPVIHGEWTGDTA